MFSNYFISTLVFIIVSLVVLFQGEIKEGFVQMAPTVYGASPANGMVPNPYFGPWTGNGGQFIDVDFDASYDKHGKPLRHHEKRLGYDTSPPYSTPPAKPVVPLPQKSKSYGPSKVSPASKEGYSSVERFDGVQIEAARNMQPMIGGAPRFNPNQSPHLNLSFPIDNARYAVDPSSPIVNYGSNDVYADDGQAQNLSLPVRENYDDSQQKLPTNMMSLGGQPAQPVVIDRVSMQALAVNGKSRLRGLGDPFRGDLKIVPPHYMSDGNGGFKEREYTKHFQVSVKPNRDLNPGYLSIHNISGAEHSVAIASTGVESQLFDDKSDNLESAKAIVGHRAPNAHQTSLATFGPTMMGRQNATTVRNGSGIEVDTSG